MVDQQSTQPTQHPQNDEINSVQQLLHQLTLTLQSHNANSTNHTTPPTDHGSKVRLREPDTFTGNNCDQQVVDGWIRSIERHRNFHGWNPERTVAFAITFLKNHADTWYRTLEENDLAPTHWIEFKNIFIAKFRPGNAYDLARDKLVNLRQTATIQEYIKQFANTIILIPELHQLEAYDRFMRGLKVEHDQLFAELRAVDVDLRTIDLAYSKSSAFEASHVRRDSRGRVVSSPIRPGHASITQADDPMDLDAIVQRGGSNYPYNNNNQFSSWRPNNKNNNTNTNNYNNYNGNNRPPRRRNGNNYTNSNNGGGYPPCRLCSKSGHAASNCHLLSVVISAVNNAKSGSQRSSINYMQTNSDATSDNSNGSIIENKNDSSNHYSHMSSFFNNNNSPSLSVPIIATADSVIKTVNNAVSPSSSTLLSTVSISTEIGCSSNFPMELVPVIKTTHIGHQHELNYVLQLNSDSWTLGTGENSVRLLPIHSTSPNLDNNFAGGDAAIPRPQLSYLISKKQVNNCLRDGGSGFLLYMKDSAVSSSTPSNDVLSANKNDDDW
ncbi:hypothetical protein INT48_004792, partial [Thamnidium elegans]